MNKYAIVDFGGYYNSEEMKNYLQQFFPVSDTEIELIFQKLKGITIEVNSKIN